MLCAGSASSRIDDDGECDALAGLSLDTVGRGESDFQVARDLLPFRQSGRGWWDRGCCFVRWSRPILAPRAHRVLPQQHKQNRRQHERHAGQCCDQALYGPARLFRCDGGGRRFRRSQLRRSIPFDLRPNQGWRSRPQWLTLAASARPFSPRSGSAKRSASVAMFGVEAADGPIEGSDESHLAWALRDGSDPIGAREGCVISTTVKILMKFDDIYGASVIHSPSQSPAAAIPLIQEDDAADRLNLRDKGPAAGFDAAQQDARKSLEGARQHLVVSVSSLQLLPRGQLL